MNKTNFFALHTSKTKWTELNGIKGRVIQLFKSQSIDKTIKYTKITKQETPDPGSLEFRSTEFFSV